MVLTQDFVVVALAEIRTLNLVEIGTKLITLIKILILTSRISNSPHRASSIQDREATLTTKGRTIITEGFCLTW